ncbi:MAG: M15 family metallopeptidase [Anaerolineae bacterium]|nr:M15 family metallopeptidase [Gloeobacterales cyanobacterium ES-bin-313]
MLATPVFAKDLDPLVEVTKLTPTIRLDMRYATPDNFLHRAVYSKPTCLLHKSVADRLALAQKRLAVQGYGLKLWDCYRPHAVQVEMWALVPDDRYVADPKKGSRHNRGAAVDLTLVDTQGQDLEMPTAFDDFTEKAARASKSAWTPQAQQHYEILNAAMSNEAFSPLPSEWWHYDAPAWERFAILDKPL